MSFDATKNEGISDKITVHEASLLQKQNKCHLTQITIKEIFQKLTYIK
jgi:hypothetical protein